MVIPEKYQWVIFVDITVLQHNGNLFDATFLAAAAALRNAQVPQLSVFEIDGNSQDFDVEQEKPPVPLTSMIGDDIPVGTTSTSRFGCDCLLRIEKQITYLCIPLSRCALLFTEYEIAKC